MEGLDSDSTDRERGNGGKREEGESGSGPHLRLIVPEGLPEAEPDLCSVTIPADHEVSATLAFSFPSPLALSSSSMSSLHSLTHTVSLCI